MKGMKCPQCGLVNFATAPKCKRCQHEFPSAQDAPASVPTEQFVLPSPAFNRIARLNPGESLPEYEAKATPIGGWLIVFAIGLAMTIGLCALFIPEYIKMFSSEEFQALTTPGSKVYVSSFSAGVTLEFIWMVTAGIGSILLLIRFFRKSSSFPRMAMCILGVNIVVAFLDYLLGLNIQHELTEKLAAIYGRGKVPTLIPDYVWLIILYSIISSVLWIGYFLSSRRVESTFIY